MERTGDILNRLNRESFLRYEGDKLVTRCHHCGKMIALRYQQGYCPACGTKIRFSTLLWQKATKKIPDTDRFLCPYCQGTGVVIVREQLDGVLYQYGYRCVCSRGCNRRETAIPQITRERLEKLKFPK